ncbi:hypothetical protein, variant, partial [Phytophthora nicotianae CJ01A1]
SSPLELGAVPAAVTVAIEGVLGLLQRSCSWACRARRRSTSSRSARSSARRALFPASANTVVVPGRDAAGAALCVILNAGAVVDSGRLDTACPGSNEAINVSRLKPRLSLLSASVVFDGVRVPALVDAADVEDLLACLAFGGAGFSSTSEPDSPPASSAAFFRPTLDESAAAFLPSELPESTDIARPVGFFLPLRVSCCAPPVVERVAVRLLARSGGGSDVLRAAVAVQGSSPPVTPTTPCLLVCDSLSDGVCSALGEGNGGAEAGVEVVIVGREMCPLVSCSACWLFFRMRSECEATCGASQ